MKRTLLLLSLATTLATSRADLILEQAIESPVQNGTFTMHVKGSTVRVDIPNGPMGSMSTIMNADTGDTVTLLHAQKMMMKISGTQTKQMMEMMKGKMAHEGKEPAPGKMEATGQKEKVGAYDTEIYTFTTENGVQKLWIAKDYPNFEKFKGELAALSKSAAAGMGKGLTPDVSNLPGMVIKTETDINGQKMTSTLVSLKQETIDPAEFEAPADYKALQQPAAPAPAAK